MKSRRDSVERSRLTRRTATVTISAPEASMAAWVWGPSLYLPVPTMRRDWNAPPAITKGVMNDILRRVQKEVKFGTASERLKTQTARIHGGDASRRPVNC